MAFYLPVQTVADQTVTVGPLEGASFVMRFRWNMRSGWTVAVWDEAEQPIFGFRGLVLETDLFDRVRSDPRVPKGKLFLLDLQETGVEPGFSDICSGPSVDDPRGRCMLIYVPSDEL